MASGVYNRRCTAAALRKTIRNFFQPPSSIPTLTDAQLAATHNSPDGRLSGREVLLAVYIHVAHHRGQAEIYLRDKGIKPPRYMI
ncbi:MAG: DinB family protein [Terriglobales bacterium]